MLNSLSFIALFVTSLVLVFFTILFFQRKRKLDNEYLNELGAVKLPRSAYCRYWFFRKYIPFYKFTKASFGHFLNIPAAVYQYKSSYLLEWGYRRDSTNSHISIMVLVVPIKDSGIYGHICDLQLAKPQEKVQAIHLDKDYYFCVPDNKERQLPAVSYLKLIEKITKNYTQNTWNFVFNQDTLAIFSNESFIPANRIDFIIDSLLENRIKLTDYD